MTYCLRKPLRPIFIFPCFKCSYFFDVFRRLFFFFWLGNSTRKKQLKWVKEYATIWIQKRHLKLTRSPGRLMLSFSLWWLLKNAVKEAIVSSVVSQYSGKHFASVPIATALQKQVVQATVSVTLVWGSSPWQANNYNFLGLKRHCLELCY